MALQRTQYFNVFFKRLLQVARPVSTGRTLLSRDMIDPPNIHEPPIPQYEWRKDESVALKKARLIYQSRKRGMLENGLLLSTFAAKHLEHLSPVLLDEYDQLINEPSNDWDIFYWATGVKPTPPEFDNTIMYMLKLHVQNADREERFRQPDLY